jgi:2-haloacid dehalogenase
LTDGLPLAVEVLAFDVFGTLVDWRTSIAREVRDLGLDVDPEAFADSWREKYVPSMQRVQSGGVPWTKLDMLHRQSLDELLEELGVDALPEEPRTQLNLAWHRLDPWPDVGAALGRLRKRFLLVPLSNGNVRLQVDLARYAGFHWDAILGAEIVRAYKPDASTYLSVAELLDVEPDAVMLVAAHPLDLRHASQHGLCTAYVERPLEHGAATRLPPPEERAEFDLAVRDLGELADRLGA